MNRSYRTLDAAIRHEPAKIKGSRHIATAAPVANEAEVASLVEHARAEFPKANHHAFAWRLGIDASRFRYSDDGEPSGSAGKPILQQIDRLKLTCVAVVVSRIFGGTRLGVGGLMRAYGGAAAAALERAAVVERVLTATVTITHDYGDAGAIQAVLHKAQLEPHSSNYEAQSTLVIHVAVDLVDAFVASVTEATAGRATTTVIWPALEE